ncbi:MAG: AI-2E family transporter, partial [Flavobacteriaceae bacterium]
MNSNTISKGILQALGIVAGILLVFYFLYKIQAVLVYIAVAAVISLIGLPIVRFLRDKLKFNNTIAVIVTMVLMLALLFGLIRLFIPLIVEQGQNLALLDIEQLQGNLENLYQQILT